MNLNLASHHNRLARVGLGEEITKKLSNLLLKKIDCKNHIKSNTPSTSI